MTSLVLELQKKANNSDVDILELLNNAKIVAHKLKIKEFEEWIDYEIKGYPEGSKIPEYREVQGALHLRPGYAGCPDIYIASNEEYFKEICKMTIIEDIGTIQSSADKGRSYIIPNNISSSIIRELIKDNGNNLLINSSILINKIPPNELNRIVRQVRYNIIEWALKLEDEGILGEGMTFNEKEIKIAEERKENIIINVLGDYNQSTTDLNIRGNNNNIITGHDNIQINSKEDLKKELKNIAKELIDKGAKTEAIGAVYKLSELINSNDDERINKNIETAIKNEPSLKDRFKSIVLNISSEVMTNLVIEGIKNLCG
jgi:hypothetical protein